MISEKIFMSKSRGSRDSVVPSWDHPCATIRTENDNEIVIQAIYTVFQKKGSHFYFLNSSVRHWPILIILACNIKKELGVNDYSFVHLTLILLLHYLVKCRSRSLAIYNNE